MASSPPEAVEANLFNVAEVSKHVRDPTQWLAGVQVAFGLSVIILAVSFYFACRGRLGLLTGVYWVVVTQPAPNFELVPGLEAGCWDLHFRSAHNLGRIGIRWTAQTCGGGPVGFPNVVFG